VDSTFIVASSFASSLNAAALLAALPIDAPELAAVELPPLEDATPPEDYPTLSVDCGGTGGMREPLFFAEDIIGCT
jgi:hypothetical protein